MREVDFWVHRKLSVFLLLAQWLYAKHVPNSWWERTIWGLFCITMGSILSFISPEISTIERRDVGLHLMTFPVVQQTFGEGSVLHRSRRESNGCSTDLLENKRFERQREGELRSISEQCLMRYSGTPPETISGMSGMWANYLPPTLSRVQNADRVVKDLHSDCTKNILSTASKAEIAICKLCKMAFTPSPAIAGSVSATHFGNVVDYQHYCGDSFWFGLSFQGEGSRKACQLVQSDGARGICRSEGVVIEMCPWAEHKQRGTTGSLCHGFAPLRERGPRQHYMQ